MPTAPAMLTTAGNATVIPNNPAPIDIPVAETVEPIAMIPVNGSV